MAFSEFEQRLIEKRVKDFFTRFTLPAFIRDKAFLRYTLEENCIEIYELRQDFSAELGEKRKKSIVKACFDAQQKHWQIYHYKQGQWHVFQPCATVGSVHAFLQCLQEQQAVLFGEQ